MALTCPHVVWRIAPFNTSNNCFTESFEFFRCDWRWEYSVHSKDDNEMPEEIISIHLRRLTNSPACSLTKFSTIASIRDSDGEHHAVRITNHAISPEVSWCVWKKSKYYVLGHDVVQNNGCAFSLTLEPLDHLEFMDCVLNDETENYDVSCLQELSYDFEKLMTYSRNADIILRCGNTEIKAHKDVLCFRSKKFTDMIEVKDNLEKISAENLENLTLPCMDPIVFVILIRYIYTAKLPDLTNELAGKIYETAHEYSIDSLKKKCTKFMIEHLSNIDALEVLQFAIDHNDDHMKWAVSSYIASKLNILNSDEWKTFSETNQGLAVDVFKIFTERLNSRESPARL